MTKGRVDNPVCFDLLFIWS